MPSPWNAAVFTLANLEFNVSTGADAVDVYGNPRPGLHSVSLTAKFRSAPKRVRDSIGIPVTEVLLEGRAVSPMRLPSSLAAGAIAKCTLAGQAGLVTLRPAPFSSIKAVDIALGQLFYASWRAAS